MNQSITFMELEEEAAELLQQMTLKEKAELLSGSNFWETKGVERLGLLPVMVTDGPHGLRKQAGSSDHLGINHSVAATCFPTAATLACSFDTDLIRRMGEALGEECLKEKVSVILGPGANIKRSPLCGRNFEYFSEDPFLTGEMAAALIEGIQNKGVGTSMKHFAANNQETRRMVIDSIVDERALREIYLSAFERAVKKAKPWTLMCCYNKVNGEFGSQNRRLLTQIAREEWGFKGAIMTDWGAVVDRVKGLSAGLDLEMPYSGPENDEAIVAAVKEGLLEESVLDNAAKRMVCLLLMAKKAKKENYCYNEEEHHKLAGQIAASCGVLLKNEHNLLPLSRNASLAVVGEFAKLPRYQGAGSSRINPFRMENLCDVLAARKVDFTYAKGYSSACDETDENELCLAAKAARNKDAVIVCIGLPDAYESEGFDRDHMCLPKSHIQLLQKMKEVNPNTIVLLYSGSAVEMPWLADARALLMLYLGGEAGALGAADLLFGDVNPSGRLAESFPHKLEDNPSYSNFPGSEKTVEYRESIFVGYRYYDKAGADVLFPFGYGLSYTEFAYDQLTVTKGEESTKVSLMLMNTGTRAGAEVVQIYVSQMNPAVCSPIRELKGFQKVFLEPGEKKEVIIILDSRAYAYYSVSSHDWVTQKGTYRIEAASSSRDIRLAAELDIEGEEPKKQDAAAYREAYHNLSVPLVIGENDFEVLYGKKLPPAIRESGEVYTLNSTLGEISATNAGKTLLSQMQNQLSGMGSSDDEDADDGINRMFERMMSEIPVRALAMFSQGAMGLKDIQKLLIEINREAGLL